MEKRDSSKPPADTRVVLKPLKPLVRLILVSIGTAALVLGIIGIYVPGLPTTPFLLLAAACYMRSSERLYRWITAHPTIGPHVNLYLEKKAIPLKAKIVSLMIAWTVLLVLVLFVVDGLPVKMLLLGIGVVKTVVMARIGTL